MRRRRQLGLIFRSIPWTHLQALDVCRWNLNTPCIYGVSLIDGDGWLSNEHRAVGVRHRVDYLVNIPSYDWTALWASLLFISFWWAVKRWGIVFSKGFSYMTLSWSVRRVRSVVESSVQNIKNLQYIVNRWFTSSWQNFVQPDQWLTRRKLKKAYSDRRQIGRDRCSFRSLSEKVTAPISSSVRGVKIDCTRSNIIA
jgi:hypothetical protein